MPHLAAACAAPLSAEDAAKRLTQLEAAGYAAPSFAAARASFLSSVASFALRRIAVSK